MADSDIKKDDAGEQTERVLPEAELTNPVVPEAVEEDKTQEYQVGGFEHDSESTINVPSVEKFHDGEIVEITDPEILATGDNDGQWRVIGYERDARGIPVLSEDPSESDAEKKKKFVVLIEEVVGGRTTKVFETDIKRIGEGSVFEDIVSLPEKMEGREVIIKNIPWRIVKVAGEAQGGKIGEGVYIVLRNDQLGVEMQPISLEKLAAITEEVVPK
ncbi:MAG: hypothetical protein QY311_03090 [Candidatus Paceibacterota bacterium]|nr:MAG: hypothetical protein QY311_03090 [Candidatus Paceibacterota bacterium]